MGCRDAAGVLVTALLFASACDRPEPPPAVAPARPPAPSAPTSDLARAKSDYQKYETELAARRRRWEGKTVYVLASGTFLPTAPAEGRDKVENWAVWHARADCGNYRFCKQYYRYVEATMKDGVPKDAGGRGYDAPTPCRLCTD